MSDGASEAHVTSRKPAAKADNMAGSPGEAVTPAVAPGTARAGPPPCGGAGPAVPPLPRRAGGISLPAMPATTIRPVADPALLRRVLDGLKQL